MQEAKQTIGEKRVRTEFNPSKEGNVEYFKQNSAKMIDVLEDFRIDERHTHSPETLRLISIAQTKIEEAAMWSVKAVTGCRF